MVAAVGRATAQSALREVRVVGGRANDLVLAPSGNGFGFDLGASFRTKKP